MNFRVFLVYPIRIIMPRDEVKEFNQITVWINITWNIFLPRLEMFIFPTEKQHIYFRFWGFDTRVLNNRTWRGARRGGVLLYGFWSFGINDTKTFDNRVTLKPVLGSLRDVALIIISLTDSIKTGSAILIILVWLLSRDRLFTKVLTPDGINQLKSTLGNQDRRHSMIRRLTRVG